MSRGFELPNLSGSKARGFAWHEAAASNGNHRGAEPGKLIREEISKLVQRVFLMPENGGRPRAVLFTGIENGQGTNLLCARAGDALAAQVTGTVCLLDANLSRPSLHAHFGIENDRGLAEALQQADAPSGFATRIADRNLWLVRGGSEGSGMSLVGRAERLRAFVGGLRRQYDYVLINAPPAGLSAEAVLLGEIADGVILVVEANLTRRDAARKAKDSFEAASIRLLGTVLNNRTFPIPEKLYRRI